MGGKMRLTREYQRTVTYEVKSLPVGPLSEAIELWYLSQPHRTLEYLALSSGVSNKTIQQIRRRKRPTVHLNTVEKVCMGLQRGWEDVYADE